MINKIKKVGVIFSFVSLIFVLACTKKETSTQESISPVEPTQNATPDASQAKTEIVISTKGSEMLYDKSVLEVKVGETVKITFKNPSNSGLQHNLVIVKPGTQDQVAQEGIAAGVENGWVQKNSPHIIAATKLLSPGESETLIFQAPAVASDTPFLCTFPGHAGIMKGVIRAQ